MAKSEASDYVLPLYKSRALKYLIQLSGGKKAIKLMTDEQKMAMKNARDKIAYDMQFNQLKWFKPFEYQKKFFATGSTHTRRGMIAANRSGKTIASTFETAYHLNG